jgi:hypothetical protein
MPAIREIEKALDEVAREIGTAVREVQEAWQRKWSSDWRSSEPVQSVCEEMRRMPDRVSDLAVGGSCAMRYLVGYSLKGLAVLLGVGGLIVIGIAIAHNWSLEPLCVGLGLVAAAQAVWWGGRLVHRSADRRRYARDQHRLIRLARERGGSLTVLEAAADCRMPVDKAEEILRDLAVRGHAEVRVSESGMVVYHFLEIERQDEKGRARPVDEL